MRQEALRAKNEAASKVAMAADGPSTSRAGAAANAAAAAGAAGAAGNGAAGASPAEAASIYARELAAIPQFKEYGKLLKSSAKAAELTERETEYVVSAVKHVYAEHIVVQYNITNTLPDTVLENVAVVVGGAADAGLKEDFILPHALLSQDNPSGVVYVSFTRVEGPDEFPQGALSNTLKFMSKEVDPTTGEAEEEGYDDEYQTEDLDLGVADYVGGRFADFSREWEAMANASVATETFALTALESLQCESCAAFSTLHTLTPLSQPHAKRWSSYWACSRSAAPSCRHRPPCTRSTSPASWRSRASRHTCWRAHA
jgi:coatomer protein complex subunit gamma